MVARQLQRRDIIDQRVLDVMAEVPRERFISPEHHHEAYADRPVPIGCGQTISQPYIVALMVQHLRVGSGHRVLDVGAGSGYQTAILAKLAKEVFAIERIAALASRARATLAELALDNVTITVADGTLGWAAHAPFDRIICGAAGPDVPQLWIDQLVDGGRIVMPTGGRDIQTLIALEKRGVKTARVNICGVRFVHLIGQQGWADG